MPGAVGLIESPGVPPQHWEGTMSRKISSILFNLARLQADIDREQRRPGPDWIALLRLKLLRLRLKARMQAAIVSAAGHRRRPGQVTA
jgi:hypothetical protein